MFPFIILAIVELVSFGLLSGGIGFYHDDWYMLETAAKGTNLAQTTAAFAATGLFPSRPANLVWLPPMYWLGGQNAFFYQVILLGLDAVLGLLLYHFLKRLTRQEGFSLLAACLALMSPNRSVTHVWFSNLPQGIAMVLVLAALVAHQNWLKHGRLLALIVGQTAYVLSLLTYESGAFLPLMLAGGLVMRALAEGSRLKTALVKTVSELAPFALTLLLALLWQRFGLPALFGAASPKTTSLSLAHILKVYGAGLECLSNRVLHVCWNAWPAVWNAFGPGIFLPGATLAILISRFIPLEKSYGSTEYKVIGGAAFGGVIGAYAPYALSSSYMPQIFGLMSRTNGGASLMLGMLLAATTIALAPKIRKFLLLAIACAFTAANWKNSVEWSQSWALQKDILSRVVPLARNLPPQAMLVLKDAPGYIGHAIVFDASWDFGPALRLNTARNDLSGTVWNPRLQIAGDGVYTYDYAADNLTPARPLANILRWDD